MAIVFEHKGTNYTLEFTRDSIKQLEKAGFSLSDVEDKPYTSLMTLFRGAFLCHHARVSQTVIDEIWDNLGNKEDMFEALANLYNEPIEAMMAEPDEGKKIGWKVV